MSEERPKRMALITSQGTLDWAYPPFILASTAVAMEMEVAVFFTFYGLTLLKENCGQNRPAGQSCDANENAIWPEKLPEY